MKKLLLLAILSCSLLSASAQHTTPRFGITNNSNRTFTSVSLGYKTLTDTLGATPDTLTIGGANYDENCFERTYVLTLKDSCVLSWSSVASAWLGDRMTLIIENGAVSGWVQFIGYSGLASKWNMQSGTTKISPTASRPYVARFVFDGATWCMISKSQD